LVQHGLIGHDWLPVGIGPSLPAPYRLTHRPGYPPPSGPAKRANAHHHGAPASCRTASTAPEATGSPATQGPAGALRLVLVAGRAQQPDPHVGDLSGYDLAGQAQRGVLLVGGAVLGHPQFHVAALQVGQGG